MKEVKTIAALQQEELENVSGGYASRTEMGPFEEKDLMQEFKDVLKWW